jgi:hypothetical protein
MGDPDSMSMARSYYAQALKLNNKNVRAGTSASYTTKTGRDDIAEILLKVVLNTINQSNQ